MNNEKPFEYHTSDGVIFKCKRSDLSMPIMVTGLPLGKIRGDNLSAALMAVAEMAAYHRGVILPTLNGFAGYDCLHFKEEYEDQDTVLTTSRDEKQEREEDSRICMDISPLGTYTGTI